MSILPLLAVGERATNDLSIFDPASPPAESIRNLSFLVFAITGFIFVVVEGILFYAVFRFRRKDAGDATEPPQVYGSKPIEVAWTAAPTMIVFILVLVTTRTLWDVEKDRPKPREGDNTLFVTVIGRQWWWEFQYTDYNGRPLGFITANELHVPLSRTVSLELQSADVAHSFWVPRLAGKTDLIPGRKNHLWFSARQRGLFLGQCAEYCGTQHANMLIRVVVDPPEDFDRWVEDQARPAADDPGARDARVAFLSTGCVNCHTVRGTPARGTYAPDLTHLMSRQTIAAGMIDNNEENLRRWVDNPQAIKPGCLMPPFGLGARERDRIVSYLVTLK